MFAISFALAAISAANAQSVAPPARAALSAYLDALRHGNYTAAYALLTKGEQRYFKSASNFASVFTADRFRLLSYAIGAQRAQARGVVVVQTRERVSAFDVEHQVQIAGDTQALYGIVSEGSALRIRDRLHPWKSFVPPAATASKEKFSATIHKVSFYSDRIELVTTFANTGEGVVTTFPYGRSVIRDERGRIFPPVDSRAAAHIDNELFLGLRLPQSGQYTGVVAFHAPGPNYAPSRLWVTFAPGLRDGDDNPFEISLEPIAVPPG